MLICDLIMVTKKKRKKKKSFKNIPSDSKKKVGNKASKINNSSTLEDESLFLEAFYSDIPDKELSHKHEDTVVQNKNKKQIIYSKLNKYGVSSIRVNDEIDLHGRTQEESFIILENFITRCYMSKLQVVKIISGKGKHSEQGRAVLPGVVNTFLKNCQKVDFFFSGTHFKFLEGTFLVFLKSI